jgi:hypothetical protein
MFKDLHQQDSLELLCVLLDSIRTEEIGESSLVSLRQPLSFCVSDLYVVLLIQACLNRVN